jgi:polyisoprenoid-binding protein YceI
MTTFAAQTNTPSTTMNRTSLSITALAALFLVACGPSEAEIQAAKEKATADSLAALAAMEKTYVIDPSQSTVRWRGVMLGVKSHHGTVGLVEGKFSVKGPQLTAGAFKADLNTIAPLDSAYAPDDAKQGTRSMLVGHLKSDQFFDVANFPDATLNVTEVKGNTATANFTVRGKTNTETIENIVITEENGVAKATGTLTFDRQKYGVAWSSGSKDAVLSDNIELTVELTGNLVQ